MRVELPSGGWVELRDALKAKDKHAVQAAVKFTIADGGRQEVSAGVQNDMQDALLGLIITAWSFAESCGWPIPAGNPGGTAILGELDIDDYNALIDAVDPIYQKVRLGGGGSPNSGKPATV